MGRGSVPDVCGEHAYSHGQVLMCVYFFMQDYVAQGAEAKLPKLAVAEDVFASLEAMAAKQGKSVAHLASETLRSSLA